MALPWWLESWHCLNKDLLTIKSSIISFSCFLFLPVCKNAWNTDDNIHLYCVSIEMRKTDLCLGSLGKVCSVKELSGCKTNKPRNMYVDRNRMLTNTTSNIRFWIRSHRWTHFISFEVLCKFKTFYFHYNYHSISYVPDSIILHHCTIWEPQNPQNNISFFS